MAILSIKKTHFTPQQEKKIDRGLSRSAKAKGTTSSQQFGGVSAKQDRNSKTLSGRTKRALVHEYRGPRRRPIE